jgi:hypothetical protein
VNSRKAPPETETSSMTLLQFLGIVALTGVIGSLLARWLV